MITIQQTRGREIEEIKPELVPVRGQMIIDTAERNFKVGDGETDLKTLPWWLHKPPKEVDGGVVEKPIIDIKAWEVKASFDSTLHIRSIDYGNDMLLAVGNGDVSPLGGGSAGYFFYSKDNGDTWERKFKQSNPFFDVVFHDGYFYTTGVNRKVNDENGEGSFSAKTPYLDYSISHSADKIVIGANYLGTSYSVDGNTFIAKNPFGASTIESIVNITYGDGSFVGVTNKGNVIVSDDWINFNNKINISSKSLNGVCFGNGIFTVVGNDGVICISRNKTDWTAVNSGTNKTLMNVYYSNGTFIAVGADGTILISSDAETWTSSESGVTSTLTDCVFVNGHFIVTGYNGIILRSI